MQCGTGWISEVKSCQELRPDENGQLWMKILRKFISIFDRIEVSLAVVSCVLIAFVGLAICYEVVMRYFFNNPTTWSAEVSRFALVYITFLGVAWVLKKEGHVKVDILTSRLSPRTQALVNAIHSIISAIVCLVIIPYGVKLTLQSIQMGYRIQSELGTPYFLILIVVPVGIFLFFVRFLRKASEYLAKWRAAAPRKEHGYEPKPQAAHER